MNSELSIIEILSVDVVKIIIGFNQCSKWMLLSKRFKELADLVINPATIVFGSELKWPECDTIKQIIGALKWSIRNDKPDCVRSLVVHSKIDPTEFNNSAFIYACKKGHKDIVELLLNDSRLEDNPPHDNGFYEAINGGYRDIVELLIDHPRVNVNKNESYFLKLALSRGYTEIVKLFLNNENVIVDDESELMFNASLSGNYDTIELLYNDGRVDPSSDYNEILDRCASDNFLPLVEKLLKDPRIDADSINKFSIIHAAMNGNEEMVKLLLQDPRIDPSHSDNTALDYALQYKKYGVVKILLRSPRVRWTEGTSIPVYGVEPKILILLLNRFSEYMIGYYDIILQLAINENYYELVRFILTDFRYKVTNDHLFRLAITEGQVEIVKLFLLYTELDPSHHDNYYLRIASYHKHNEIKKLLLRDPRVQKCKKRKCEFFEAYKNSVQIYDDYIIVTKEYNYI